MRVLHLVESEFQGVSEARRLVETGGEVPLRPLPGFGIPGHISVIHILFGDGGAISLVRFAGHLWRPL